MSKLFFVTGASGFLASHIIYQLLQDGHRVRGTARGKKVTALKELYAAHPSIEVVDVPDIATTQFPDALVGVDVVIHTATPLAARAEPDILYKSAISGALNVLQQAEKAGITKFVVTSSIAAVTGDPVTQGVSYRLEHWNPITKEAAVGNPFAQYSAAKTLSERSVWEWAEAHPHVDVTTINPPFLYGPPPLLALRSKAGDFTSLSTNIIIYKTFTPSGVHLPSIGYADFRDTARAHIGAALNPSPFKGRKRVVFASPHGLVEKQLFDLIKEKRPDAGVRLVTGEGPKFPFDRYDVDFDVIEQVTGLKKSDFHTIEETVLDAVDSLLSIEADWKRQGFKVQRIDYLE